MMSLAAQPLCLSQYPVTKNAQNSAVCMEGTEFHWPESPIKGLGIQYHENVRKCSAF